MQEHSNLTIPTPKQVPWNKGKLIGAKPPLRQKHVWAIRTMLQSSGVRVTWRCSILPSTVNCAAAT